MTENGCIIDSHHGLYALPMLVRLAQKSGLRLTTYFEKITEMAERGEDLGDAKTDEFVWLVDEAEAYLQRQAPEGYSYGWVDGDFMFLSNEDWDDM